MGNKAICAPSKAQPPAEAPGLGLAQPDFSFLLCSQAGSSSSWAISFVDFMVAYTRLRCLSWLNFNNSNRCAIFYSFDFIDFYRDLFVGKLTKRIDGYNKPTNKLNSI
jgi:hypothetical protein